MRIDLHLHTTASDGGLTPRDLVHEARDGRLDLIAIADHDTVVGVRPAQAEASALSLDVVAAIEVSSTFEDADLHILGYFVDPESSALVDYGRAAVEGRAERMRAMVRRLEEMDVPIGFDDVVAAAGPDASTLGRPHLARALLDRGHVRTFAEAFDRFIGDHGPAFVPTNLLSPAEAIDLIHQSGGVAVWAHPPIGMIDDALHRMVGWGLDGIECHRPQNSPTTVNRLVASARALDLLVTGGSDWHGEWHGPLGRFAVDPVDIADFLRVGGF